MREAVSGKPVFSATSSLASMTSACFREDGGTATATTLTLTAGTSAASTGASPTGSTGTRGRGTTTASGKP